MSFLLALLFSTNLHAADISASCEMKGEGEFCTVTLYSCDEANQKLADELCQSKGWKVGTLDPNNELIGEGPQHCGIDAFSTYTYVGCSN
jgi:hypothetical protein